MDEMTALREMGDRLGPAEGVPGSAVSEAVEAAMRSGTGHRPRASAAPRRGQPTGRSQGASAAVRWGVPLAAAAAIGAVVLSARGLVPFGPPGGPGQPASTGRVSASTSAAVDPPLAGDRYVYTQVRFFERSFDLKANRWIEDSGTDESWASADGRGAVITHNGPRRTSGGNAEDRTDYSVLAPGWHVITELSPDMKAGTAGKDLRGDVRYGWTVMADVPIPALPVPATAESVDHWFTTIEHALVGDNPPAAPLRAATWAFGSPRHPGADNVFAMIPPSAREAVFQAVIHRTGVTRHEVTVHDGRTMIAVDGGGGVGMGDAPWHRMLFDPVTHAFAGIQYPLPDADNGLAAGTAVAEYVIAEQALVDRPGRHPDSTDVPILLKPSDLLAGDPALPYLSQGDVPPPQRS